MMLHHLKRKKEILLYFCCCIINRFVCKMTSTVSHVGGDTFKVLYLSAIAKE